MTAPRRGRRRRWVIILAVIAGSAVTIIALPVHWALTARPVGGPDLATLLHEIVVDDLDADTVSRGPAAWESMQILGAELESLEADAVARHAPTGFQFRVGPPSLTAASLTADMPLARRGEVWPRDESADEIRIGFAVADDTLARVIASGLVARVAALPPPVPSAAQLTAAGVGGGGAAGIGLPKAVSRARSLADAAAATGLLALDDGRIGEAMTALEAIVRSAQTADAVPTLLNTLHGLAIRRRAHAFIGALLDRGELSTPDLDRLDAVLRRLGPGELRRGMQGERAFLGSVILGAYDPNGRLLLAELTPLLDPAAPAPRGLARLQNLPGIFAPRRDELEARLDAIFAPPEGDRTANPPRNRSTASMTAEAARGNAPALILDLLLPNIDGVRDNARTVLAEHRAVRLAVAVARQHIETGIVPWSLDAVRVPADDPDLRIDPRTGERFALLVRSPGVHPAAGPLVVRSTGTPESIAAPSPPEWRAPSRSTDDG